MKKIFDPERFASLCKALAHPARVRILAHLLAEDRCFCGEIVKILPLAQSTVSQHLKALKEAGLVGGEVEGLCNCYCVDKTVLKEFLKLAEELMKGKIE
ncbi:MAG: helix-turn-helix transcriptional regulator [Deltaproteobacteria bacterium]|nr:helix-turn-helix transcriptional regulator [Deltaproteobacteria bacterium]